MDNTEELKKIYGSALQSETSRIEEAYKNNSAEIERQRKENAAKEQKDLQRTAVESAQASRNYNELKNAYGLSSGAMAQAKLAQDNQLQADLTAIRTARRETDDAINEEKRVLAERYQKAIQDAQRNNDRELAEALYKEAQRKDAELKRKQEAAAGLMQQAGDFSLIGGILGLTPEQIALLEKNFRDRQEASSGSHGHGGGSGGGGHAAPGGNPFGPKAPVGPAAEEPEDRHETDQGGGHASGDFSGNPMVQNFIAAYSGKPQSEIRKAIEGASMPEAMKIYLIQKLMLSAPENKEAPKTPPKTPYKRPNTGSSPIRDKPSSNRFHHTSVY